jgi:hypothetical protein
MSLSLSLSISADSRGKNSRYRCISPILPSFYLRFGNDKILAVKDFRNFFVGFIMEQLQLGKYY